MNLSPEEERALLSQLPQPDAFRTLYRHYLPRIFGYVRYRVERPEDTEDVVAEIFVKVVQAVRRFEYRGAGSFAAWLFRIAHAEVQLYYRSHRHEPIALEHVVDYQAANLPLDEAIISQEEFARLHALIRTLAPRRQEIVTLRFFGGLRNQEIAVVLGLDERTVASHLCRALEDLQQKYQEEALHDHP